MRKHGARVHPARRSVNAMPGLAMPGLAPLHPSVDLESGAPRIPASFGAERLGKARAHGVAEMRICQRSCGVRQSALAQPDDEIDPGNLVALRNRRHPADADLGHRDVPDFACALNEEVMMIAGPGVEIGHGTVDADLA